MYNNKKIKLIKRDNVEIDENGCANYNWEQVGEYWCDLQPITSEKCIKVFGTYPNVRYQIWLEKDIEGFNPDTIEQFKVIYKDIEYKILSAIEWEDDWYCINFIIGCDSIGS